MSSNEINILGVNFSEDVIEITFSESRQQSDHAAMVNQLLLQSRDHAEIIAVVLEELRDLVDEGLVLLRDPPATLNPRERMRRRAAAAASAEGSDEDLPPVSAYEADEEPDADVLDLEGLFNE